MAARDLALEMLAQGLAPSVVAGTIGVEESYISQLMGDEDFAAAVEAKRVASSQEDLDYDAKLNRNEESALDRIESKLGYANLQQSLQVFRVLNGAKRRRDRATTQHMVNNGVVVNIQLPATMVPKYLVNGNNEIVEVEGQTMISATPKHLDEILLKRKPAEAVELTKRLENAESARAEVVLDSVKPVNRRERRMGNSVLSVDML